MRHKEVVGSSYIAKKKIRTFSSDRALVKVRRDEILLEACKAFNIGGYDGTSVRTLAKALGKTTGVLYHYVGSKKDILYLILEFTVKDEQDMFADIRNKTNDLSPKETLKEAFRLYVKGLDKYADTHIFVNHILVNLKSDERHMVLDSGKRITAFFEGVLLKGVQAGEFYKHDANMLAQNINMVGASWVTRRWYWKKFYTIEEFISGQIEIILRVISYSNTNEKSKGPADGMKSE
ncbi:MAG: TetR/AcrR family transcriptional regulator [Dehalococcoidales bacterium]|nr:TetR/AcrR family transcriptional regulator [Dehalococcoidales bacterium]